ncbi:hypothetical protein KI387_017737 [Taxus chinensis]|uniref:Uncharacterized protein n=1 Tax=Taxus chinensis TaxID=29808 RepID=A0AA38GK27_TAXCH|nr:hypothetical protein KI387_017737 [Taxus chinensis]
MAFSDQGVVDPCRCQELALVNASKPVQVARDFVGEEGQCFEQISVVEEATGMHIGWAGLAKSSIGAVGIATLSGGEYKGGASPCSQSDRLPQDGQTPSAQGSARGAIQGARGTPGRGKRLARHGLGLTTSHACADRRSGRVGRVKRAG